MLADPTWSEVYAPQGYLAVEGDWIKRVNYGKTLERIAKEGPGAFYEGEIAENLVQAVKRKGGILSLDDVSGFVPGFAKQPQRSQRSQRPWPWYRPGHVHRGEDWLVHRGSDWLAHLGDD
jgi:gamma-glutamyltranspeptidase